MSSDSGQKNHFTEQYLDHAKFSMSILKWVWKHLNSKFSHLPTSSPSVRIFHVHFEVGVEASHAHQCSRHPFEEIPDGVDGIIYKIEQIVDFKGYM
jgi:hypothetical protein